MRKFGLVIITFVCAVAWTSAQNKINDDILRKSDNAYFPSIAKFKVSFRLFERDEYLKHYELNCYIKGNQKYLAFFTDPPIVRRRSQLRVGDKILMYLGKINRTTEISAKAAFAESTFSEEDILSASLGNYYSLESADEVILEGKTVLKLSLISKSKSTAYYRIETFVNKETLLPIKRNYYSFSDQKIKELQVEEIRKKSNQLEYVKMTMYDSLIEGTYTEVVMEKFEVLDNLDDRIFTKRYMEIATQ